MKKLIISILVLFVIALVLIIYIQGSKQPAKTVVLENMPWQIDLSDNGQSRVFGIDLGKTTLAEIAERWRRLDPEIGLFTNKNGGHRLEAYLGNRRLGRFDAKIVLGLGASDTQLKEFARDRIGIKPMPSGDYKQEVSEKFLPQVFQMAVNSVTYIPQIKYDEVLLERFFSKPVDIIQLNTDSAFWLYPEKGLVVLLDHKGKEVFHYVEPSRYQNLLEFLKLEAQTDT